MTPDREAALRGLFEQLLSLIEVPPPAHHADDDLYLNTLRARTGMAGACLHGLLNGPLDSTAVQATGHTLGLAAGALPATGYEVTP